MSAIVLEHVSKTYRTIEKDSGVVGALKALVRPRYRETAAVRDLSFSIAPGEVVGYIGVNGAGKSTTIKMLTGILHPSGGQVRVLGRDPHRERVANARAIGVVFGQRTQLWWDLALRESLELICHIYGMDQARYRERLKAFSSLLDLDELLAKPIRAMSLGQKMRAELAATFLHDPQVVYLDEPTIGLDVMVKERIRAFIREQNRREGTTVMLTTHDLDDIEQLCQRVIIIDSGRMVYDGPLSTIKQRFGTHRTITFETRSPIGDLTLPAGAEIVSHDERTLVVRFDRTIASASSVATALMPQIDVADFALSEPDLESIIKQLYAGAISERPAPEVAR